MKKLNTLLLLASFFMGSTAFAEAIKSDQEIAGNWLLQYTKKSPEDTESKAMNITWVLKDQKLIIKDIPQARGNPYDSAPMDYLIENGNLKVAIPGRAGKFDEYSLVEKTDTQMVLKDPKFGTHFYFTKK